ncbi:MAG: SUMF1/EgtB/PvdO family nonheme iron enzyme [Chloroflexota bacterium]
MADNISDLPTSKNLMPAPFDWINIPNKGYSMAKYPVTNAQFAKFTEAGGYHTERWWTKGGWQQKQKDSWKEPCFWQDSTFNSDTQPVVGVSWYGAVAFCLWLSDITGEKIMLPTEDQWQYAAQGDDGRVYPWGNDWDGSRCHNSVGDNNPDRTSSVILYESKGASPFGVVDMAGHVWEWCLTDYDTQTNNFSLSANRRTLRGGSWVETDSDAFRCDYQIGYDPPFAYPYSGFRIVRTENK